MDRRGQVVTFYSFKGGVGRSMALANIAALYAQRGKRVLALDFDFEAPGLHRYFLSPREEGGGIRHEPAAPTLGVLNYLQTVHEELQRRHPEGRGFDTPDAQEKLPSLLGEILDAGGYLYTVRVEDPNSKRTAPEPVYFIPAARFDETYPELVRSFDWSSFYDTYAEVFPALARELSKRYDYVLVDSRTGVTDIGSICTMLLPDKLVLVFSPNEQSLRGALDAGWQAIQGRKAMKDRPALPVFPLLSRLEDGEEKLKRMWIARAQHGFERLFREAYGIEPRALETYFNAVRVPHRGYYAYGERIAVEEQLTSEIGSLAQAYHQFAESLDRTSVEEAQESIQQSGFSAQEEGMRSLIGQMQGGMFREIAKQTPLGPLLRLMEAEKDFERGRFEDALRVCDEVIGATRNSTDNASRVSLASALEQKVRVLGKLEQHGDALAICEEIAERFGHESYAPLSLTATHSRFNAGTSLRALGRNEEALQALEDARHRYAKQQGAEARAGEARSLLAMADLVATLHEHERALGTLDVLLQKFGAATQLPILLHVAHAMNRKAVALYHLGRYGEALAAREEMVQRFRDSTIVDVRREVTVAILGRVGVLWQEKRLEEALEACEDALRRLEGATDSEFIEHMASALTIKAKLLHELSRDEEALASVGEVQRRFGEASELALRRIVAQSLTARLTWSFEAGKIEDFLFTCDDYLRRFGEDVDSEIRDDVCHIMLVKSIHLQNIGRYGEAAATSTHAYERFQNAPEPGIQEVLPQALILTGSALLFQAKEIWQGGDEQKARVLLQEASERLALARERRPADATDLEIATHAAFLLGREDEARALLGEALVLDRAGVLEAVRKDLDIHPLPQDEAFRNLVSSLAGGEPV